MSFSPAFEPGRGSRGADWHNSYEKRIMGAAVASKFRYIAWGIACQALRMLAPHGYTVFNQERVLRINGVSGLQLFDMPKIQTMARTDHKLHASARTKLFVPEAETVRYTGVDELVQVSLVSDDPEAPGIMALTGRRPQMIDELDHMEYLLSKAGCGRMFDDYAFVHDALPPAMWGPESLLDEQYEPGSLPFYKARVCSLATYFETGDALSEFQMLTGIMTVGLCRFAETGFFMTPPNTMPL